MPGNPIQQVEEAIFLLRRQDARAWLQYLLAAVPFLLVLLAFVHDMSAGYLAGRCAIESLVCALVFFWSSAWKARFGGTLLASMNGPDSPSPQAGFWKVLYLQSVLQSLKLAAFPFAIVSVLPIAWTSGFFRNASIEAGMPGATLRSVMVTSAQRASFNARGNWAGVLILCLVYLLVFVNVSILAGALPFLVRAFTGAENSATRNVSSLFSFNSFCVLLALTWLLIDPLVLSYCVVRCFYAEARTDGRDLLAKLQQVAALALLALLLTPNSRLVAAEAKAQAVSQQQVSHAFEHASQSDDYGWLRTRNEARSGPGDAFFKRLGKDMNSAGHALKSLLSNLRKWLREVLRRSPFNSQASSSLAASKSDVHWLLYIVAALVSLAAVVVLLRTMNKPTGLPISGSGEMKTPDLKTENVLASDLPEDEWLRMAQELAARGENRLAIRAMYLSNLSFLGSQQLLKIAKAKSNSIYERELRQRPQGSQASGPFAQSNRSFERAWYGFHEVTPEFIEVFQQDVEAIRRYAKA